MSEHKHAEMTVIWGFSIGVVCGCLFGTVGTLLLLAFLLPWECL